MQTPSPPSSEHGIAAGVHSVLGACCDGDAGLRLQAWRGVCQPAKTRKSRLVYLCGSHGDATTDYPFNYCIL